LAQTLIALLAQHGRVAACEEITRSSLDRALNAQSALHAVGRSAAGRSALIRRFTRTFGLSPLRYQRNLRCISAKALMRDGMPLAQVAHELGFSDQPHFTREFKKVHGITPGQYRQAADRSCVAAGTAT